MVYTRAIFNALTEEWQTLFQIILKTEENPTPAIAIYRLTVLVREGLVEKYYDKQERKIFYRKA